MSNDTWRVRSLGDRWVVPRRDDLASELRPTYALYFILLSLQESTSVFNAGEFNTFLIGDTGAYTP